MKSPIFKPNVLFAYACMDQGFTQPDLARRLGVTPKQVWRWEKGLAQPRPHTRHLLCIILSKTPAELAWITHMWMMLTQHTENPLKQHHSKMPW